MKKAALTLTMILAVVAMFGQEVKPAPVVVDGPVLTVDKETHDYGTVEQGANGTCEFTVTNTGNAPLILNRCKGSCGCTVPECSGEPIAPGASTIIKVKYDTKRSGPFHKSVTITSNAVNAPTKVVKIKGTVKAKPAAQPTPQTN